MGYAQRMTLNEKDLSCALLFLAENPQSQLNQDDPVDAVMNDEDHDDNGDEDFSMDKNNGDDDEDDNEDDDFSFSMDKEDDNGEGDDMDTEPIDDVDESSNSDFALYYSIYKQVDMEHGISIQDFKVDLEKELDACNHSIGINDSLVQVLKNAMDAFIVAHFCTYRAMGLVE
jgi:hypothetical protein